jgi:hypothetical protein
VTGLADPLEEALDDCDASSLPDAGEPRVIRQVLIEGGAEGGAMRQVRARRRDELGFGAKPVEEHDQLKLTETTGSMDGRPRSADNSRAHSRTTSRLSLASRWREKGAWGTSPSSETAIGAATRRGLVGPSLGTPRRGSTWERPAVYRSPCRSTPIIQQAAPFCEDRVREVSQAGASPSRIAASERGRRQSHPSDCFNAKCHGTTRG